MKNKIKLLKKLTAPFGFKALGAVAAFSLFGFMSQAHAAGTVAGTSISNTANLNFSIGAVAQNAISSNTVSFVVDNKINMVLIEDNGAAATTVVPGSLKQIIRFKLTNLGNSTQDYQLPFTNQGNGTTLYSQTDNFDANTCNAFVDSPANNGIYDEGVDVSSFVDELQPDNSKYIFLRCNIPATQINNDFAVMTLRAQAAASGTPGVLGPVMTQTTGANTAGIDVVFAEAVSSSGNGVDAARNGIFSANGAYLVQTSKLTVVKDSVPICDPFNFNTTPKNIPGSFVRYSITIANAADAGSSATLGTISDVLSIANLTFDPNLIAPTTSSCDSATPAESAVGRGFKLTCVGGSRDCVATPLYKTGASDADGFAYAAPNITANLFTGLPAEGAYAQGELKAGESVKLEFNVQVK